MKHVGVHVCISRTHCRTNYYERERRRSAVRSVFSLRQKTAKFGLSDGADRQRKRVEQPATASCVRGTHNIVMRWKLERVVQS